MKAIFHQAEQRGHANHGWLNSYHSFSFASFYNPEKVNFGMLRVLNDDIIQGGTGFGTHPHHDMEIISIPLSGALEHQDSMGHSRSLNVGEVQVMSAGTGLTHSEYNHLKDGETNFLQIWIFPREKGLAPRYEQKYLFDPEIKNSWQTLVSPDHDTQNGSLWIHQDSYMNRAILEENEKLSYQIHQEGQGVYVFVIDGEVEVNGEKLQKKDAIGIWELDQLEIKSSKEADILLIEVPMH